MTPTPPARVSPAEYRYVDSSARVVSILVHFNLSTLAIINPGLQGNKQAGCVFTNVQIGRETDPGGIKIFPLPDGAFGVNRTQLANAGFSFITDIDNTVVVVGV